jgi:hypothetical protein
MMLMPFGLLLCWVGNAFATSAGALPPGAQSYYGGLSYGAFSTIADASDAEAMGLSKSVVEMGLTGLASIGFEGGLDVEVLIPLGYHSYGDDSTMGLYSPGVVVKKRLLQEGLKGPVTLSVLAGLRSGAAHVDGRSSMTNLGEGTNDVSAGLALGRWLPIGVGFGSFEANTVYYKRLPIGADRDYPKDDLTFHAEVGYSFHPSFGLAAVVDGFDRMGGLEFGSTGGEGDDKWAALDATQVKAGGGVDLYLGLASTLLFRVLRTVYAKNNPSDNLVFVIGFNLFRPPSKD